MKILVGSPVRQKNNILKEFLQSLEELDKEGLQVDYYFVDDNTDEESSNLLKNFMANKGGVLKKGEEIVVSKKQEYVCDSTTHHWKRGLIEKITKYKDTIIEYAHDENYDFLFFIDSDIVLNVKTLKHLISRNVDIVSNVFWTQWAPGGMLKPQVWMQDIGSCLIYDWDNPPTAVSQIQAEIDLIAKLRIPGIYEVGGLGACTLISKNALDKGVRFELIKNISFWGEDRHFCVRAAALGLKLYVDNIYPAYHIYREEYLSRVQEFKEKGFSFDMCQSNNGTSSVLSENSLKAKLKKVAKKVRDYLRIRRVNLFDSKRVIGNNKIVVSMIVHNEEGRYLERVLENVKTFADSVLIIDDASTDNTVAICEDALKDFPHKIIKNKKSMFKTEYKLRLKQWKNALKMGCDWIYCIDADEIIEDSFKEKLPYLLNNKDVDVYNFRLYDMWNENEYRDDEYWCAHTRYMTFLVRFQPNFPYKFKKTNQHCGRFPKNLNKLRNANVDVKVKHMGWARKEDREYKYKRYMQLDKDCKCGVKEQYMSILDENPNLKVFGEDE